MSSARVVEAGDVFEDGNLEISAGLPGTPPDQFDLDGFDEDVHRSLIMAVSFTAH